MLQIRPSCENCNKTLPPNSTEARICTFECTFCSDCVDNTLHNVCPNCGGGFVQRPVRPKDHLVKYPATEKVTYKPVNMETFSILLEQNRAIKMEDR